MPRRRRPEPREVVPDPLYNSTLVEKFVNSMMWDGKKTTAQKLFYQAMDLLRERSGDDPLKAFKKAVENVKPMLEVKTRRVGGANYQVPVEVPQNRRTSLALRSNMRGGAVKKKDDVHRMAEANKAFAHYRW
jgi:small subunit ribosomal protein S7